ncbi:hypothetical protein GIB67_015878, partial [Kingdonia uniflora]
MFTALPEEENGVLRTTCFTPLLLIDPIATMSMLVVEIFDRHFGLRVSPIANEFLFVDPVHMTNFRMRRFPKKKNTYGLKEIDDALKHAKLEKHQEDVLRLNLLKIILSFLLPSMGRNVWVKYVDLVDDLDQFNRFPWGDLKFLRIEESIHLFPKLQRWRITSFKRRQIVTIKKFFANPKLLIIVIKPSETDMQQCLVQKAMRNQIEAPAVVIPAVGAPVIGSSSSATEIGAVVVKKKGEKKDNDDKKDVEENVKFEEEKPQVVGEEDSEPPTVVVYYNGKKDVQHANETMVVAEVGKTDIVFFNQEEVDGEVYQASADQTTVVSIEEQTLEIKKTKDKASQASADQTAVVFVEEQTIEVAQTDVAISHQEEDVGEASQSKESKEEVAEGKEDDNRNSHNKSNPEQVIDVYIKALIQYFDTQHHARPDKEKIVLEDIFTCQYIGMALNVRTRNISSPE